MFEIYKKKLLKQWNECSSKEKDNSCKTIIVDIPSENNEIKMPITFLNNKRKNIFEEEKKNESTPVKKNL